jgi:hypothetical protein
MSQLLTPKEAAALVKVHYKTLMIHIRGYRTLKGERLPMDRLPVKQVGTREYRIDEGELMIFINRYNDPLSYQQLMKRHAKTTLRKVA